MRVLRSRWRLARARIMSRPGACILSGLPGPVGARAPPGLRCFACAQPQKLGMQFLDKNFTLFQVAIFALWPGCPTTGHPQAHETNPDCPFRGQSGLVEWWAGGPIKPYDCFMRRNGPACPPAPSKHPLGCFSVRQRRSAAHTSGPAPPNWPARGFGAWQSQCCPKSPTGPIGPAGVWRSLPKCNARKQA